MDDYLLWLLATSGLGLLAGALWLRRRAARRRAELQAQTQRLAAESAEVERIDAELRREAAEQAERERVAAAEADAAREAQRLAAEQAAREDAARAEASHQAALQAEELRLAAQRAEAERVEAERVEAVRVEAERVEAERVEAARVEAARVEAERVAAELAAEQLERERLAALQAERDAAARAEAQRLAEQRAEQERIAAERAEAERIEAERAAAAPRRVVKTAAQTLVLVADDSKVVRIKTGRLLAQHHYQVAYASDGLDAVQQMQARLPDVLITDVEMPGLDGFELTRQLRADPQTAELPVIMITAADDRHREQADAAGVSVLLGKPYPEDALIAHIRQALGQDAEAALATGNSAHGALDALA